MNKIQRIEKYIFEYFSSRFDDISIMFKSVQENRRTEIYKLKRGNELFDFFSDIYNIIQNYLFYEKLIPQKFATLELLMDYLKKFKIFLKEKQELLEINSNGINTYYIVNDLNELSYELIKMIDFANSQYDYEDTVIPYQELRYSLIVNNIDRFIEILKSIIASVPYTIYKSKEGFYHSNVHLILKLLGFDISSEDTTNNGRIDAVIRFSDKISIIEFKFGENENLSGDALQQIKDKEYSQKFQCENIDIYGIGISFSEKTRNINDSIYEKLF